jgi:drug/metabolite transporter (DMT)-like permease
MNLPWFKRNGMFFIPVTVVGWLIVLAGLIYSVYIFIDIDSTSHSVSDTLIIFVLNLLIIGAVYSLIGYLTSRTPKT